MGEQSRRVLVIGLDGFEYSLAEAMMAEGQLPNIRRLAAGSARFKLDHGWAKYSGLAWEHFSAGKSPDGLRRWSAVSFDRESYSVRQEPTAARPFLADVARRAVVFDIPYFDLAQAPGVLGLTSWGAHDPGVGAMSRPIGLADELRRRFGVYPADQWIYGFTWPSVAKTKALGSDLRRAVELRGDAARWLLTERLLDWDLAIVVVSESHSAIEPLWHGHDAQHPLHEVASAQASRNALREVYVAIDGLVGKLQSAMPEATTVLFAMHGMGSNDADIPAMFLVPELMYRHAFGRPYARDVAWREKLTSGVPLLAQGENWDHVMRKVVPWPATDRSPSGRLRRVFNAKASKPGRKQASTLAWMPAARYALFWPQMPAFALPAYYDGQIRINVAGREANGLVARQDYEAARSGVIALLQACRDPLSGSDVVSSIVMSDKDPDELGPTEADIYLTFHPGIVAIAHDRLGMIGPVPYRRTGGHTGAWGFLHVSGAGVAPGDKGTASSFDVVPTLLDLVRAEQPPDISGRSLIDRIR